MAGHACSVLQHAEFGMTFTVHGVRNGKPVQVTWRDDGRLEGDPDLVEMFQAYVEAGEPIDVRPDGAVVEADLADPIKAFTLIVMYIPVVTALEGDPPPGIDFAAELADLHEDQERQAQREHERARRWWRRLRRL
ncbi:MAG TPA: hypothetical protein VFA46_20175 [Actinomycetes bacterium]|nr:hypothetical protein [Actinomycetes bacterium]